MKQKLMLCISLDNFKTNQIFQKIKIKLFLETILGQNNCVSVLLKRCPIKIYEWQLYVFSINILSMVETVLQKPWCTPVPLTKMLHRNSFFQHLETGENIKCNHLGMYSH